MSEAKSWNNTPPRAADGRQDTAAVLAPGHGSARLPVKGWLTGYQGNQQRAGPSPPLRLTTSTGQMSSLWQTTIVELFSSRD